MSTYLSRLRKYSSDNSANYYPREMTELNGVIYIINDDGSTTTIDPKNAETAKKLFATRKISLTGAVTGSVSTDFSGNTEIATTLGSVPASKITGTISLDNLPQGALERMVPVDNEAARLALTTTNVQNGDVVKQTDTGLMYYISDETKLGTDDAAAAFSEFTAGSASSVPWNGVTGKPTFHKVATSGSYTDLNGKPTIYPPATTSDTPKPIGTATVGSSNKFARADHVHAHNTVTMSTNSTNTASPAAGGTFTAIDSITKDSNGHVTKYNTKTITLPTHLAVEKETDGTTTSSPTAGGTFTTVDSITRDDYGHVTKINTKTVTLPTHVSVTKSTDSTSTSLPDPGTSFSVIDSVTRDTYGHVTKVNSKTVHLPSTLASYGLGYATCSTSESTQAKVATLSSFTRRTGSIVTVYFSNANTAGSPTLNINSTGAAYMYKGTSNITTGDIKAGDRATFIFDGTYYRLISIDNSADRYTVSLPTSGWTSFGSGDTKYYRYRLSVSGLTSNDHPIVDIIPSTTYSTAQAQLEAWSGVYSITTYTSGIYVYATAVPTTSITIQLVVPRL